jgi:hypothetical protein
MPWRLQMDEAEKAGRRTRKAIPDEAELTKGVIGKIIADHCDAR